MKVASSARSRFLRWLIRHPRSLSDPLPRMRTRLLRLDDRYPNTLLQPDDISELEEACSGRTDHEDHEDPKVPTEQLSQRREYGDDQRDPECVRSPVWPIGESDRGTGELGECAPQKVPGLDESKDYGPKEHGANGML